MKNKFSRLLSTLLATFIMVTSMNTGTISVFAEEKNEESYDATEEIVELGSIDEVFGSTENEDISTFSINTPHIGERYSKIPVFDNDFGYTYITHISINGNTVFCIQPGVLFTESGQYPENYIYWDSLNEWQRQAIWEISYYGYDYPGHQTSRYYVATQLLIWEVVAKWYDPYTPDGSSYLDVSPELDEINRLRSQPQGRPSFHNSTIKMGLNTPVTVTDSKGVLGNFNISSSKGVNASVNGNSVTYEITSEDYARNITYQSNVSSYECNIVYGGDGEQKVVYLAKRKDPTPNFKVNFELLYADIEIEKQDIETGNITQGDATFDGAVFELKDLNGTVKETLTTNGSKVVSKKYPVGTKYQVCEVAPPTGYLKGDQCNLVDLTFSGDSTPSRFNTIYKDKVIKGKIEIAKTIEQKRKDPYESVISKPGVGFKFDIYLKSSGEKVTTLTTDEEGRAISELLPYGLYVVKENDTVGYDTLKPFEVMIDENEKIYFYNIYNDTLKAELNIYKIDTETGNRIPAAGVEFKIKDKDENFVKQTVTYPEKYETDVFITKEDGSVHLPEPLIFGEYKIVEIKAPYGYVLKDTEIPFNVDGSTTEIFMNFDNQAQKGQITVEKYGEQFVNADFRGTENGVMYSPIYENKLLAGVTYEIKAREGIVGQEGTLWYNKGDVVERLTTDENGKLVSSKLPLGKYTIQEVETVKGFVLDETIYDVDIEYEGQLVEVVQKHFSFNNERQKLELELKKTFEDDDKLAYKDVLFGVYVKEDITIGEDIIIPKDALVGVLTLDESGKNNEQLDLPVGNYYIKELETNVGFILDDNQYDFTYENTEDTTLVTSLVKLNEIKNMKRRIDLEVEKVDKDHHDHFLNGAIFKVKDLNNGQITYLASGQLLIKGNGINEEYEISKDENFENIVKVAKTDNFKEIILDIDDGVYYSRKINDDKVTKHIIKDGKAILPAAIYGHSYEFNEIKAPTSYHKADKSMAYTVIANKDTDTVIFKFENKRIELPNTGV